MAEPIQEIPQDQPEVPTAGSIDEIVGGFNFSDPASPKTPELPQEQPTFITSQSLDELEEEIDSAELTGKTQESINSFEGLKARYKNKISAFKTQLADLTREKEEYSSKMSKVGELEARSRAYEDLVAKVRFLEEEAETAKTEAEKNSFFRKKYDFENDPEVKRAFVTPMKELKSKSVNIIENAGLDESVWDDLIAADSEYKVNSIIDAADISGLNAQSLKSYISQYSSLKNEFSRASNPEYIESALQAARGKGQRLSDEVSNRAFTDVKEAFSKHVKEIQHSEVNKEHNLYVHDKAVEKAKAIFDSLRKTMSSEYQNPQSMASIAQASVMAAAYPFQKQLVDYLIKDRAELLKELSKASSGPSIRQSTENSNGSNTDSEFFKTTLNKSVDDIANEVFGSL